jgi:Fur family ferric uptake transcriptional regulator
MSVLQHLMEAPGPKTHAEVAEALSDRGFDRATIYRNLTELTEAKLVSRVELGDHVWRFELKRSAGHGEDHPHFLCTTCGEVSCLDDVNVAITPRKNRRIRAVTEVLLKGRCENCG